MAYFVIRLNMRIVAPDVSIPTHLESLDLDFPTGSYDFSRVCTCCWAVLGRVWAVLGYFLRLLTVELEFGPNIKVVSYHLIFPTTLGLLNLKLYNSSYAFMSDRRSVWSFFLKN